MKVHKYPRHKIEVPTGGHLEVSIEEITPEMAKAWLDGNHTQQRKINAGTVKQYIAQMKKGLWRSDTAEAIKFSTEDGVDTLSDGQHRLTAVAESGLSVFMMVVRGLKSTDITALDLGRNRSLSDLLRINCSQLPSGMSESVLASFIDGLWTSVVFTTRARTSSGSLRIDTLRETRSGKSVLELYTFFENNPQIAVQLSHLHDARIATLGKSVALTPNLLGWYVVSQIDREIADTILSTLRDGSPQTSNGFKCPAYVFLRHILKQKQEGVRIRKEEYVAHWLWCYEQISSGETRTKLATTSVHRPAQGHVNSKLLVEKFSDYVV